ncbi:MAG: DUF4422 domain-containing protein [Lachnospiraceae bacterium]|nr:DUF4422 domain-containing protein [Lachnospiraceae bacterium]
MNIKVIVATHKKYRMPEDKIYIPIHVGKVGKPDIGFTGDDTGDNISNQNSRLCELTGIYWAWKNIEADYIGLVHYRRHFTCSSALKRLFTKDKFSLVATEKEIESILKKVDVIVPNKRKYYIETMESHFLHLPYTFEKDYRVLEEVIKKKTPDYYDSFKNVMNGTSAHMFNMFIMKKELFDKYCEWLFTIILEADKKIDVTDYDRMQTRAVAYYGEFMLDVWMKKNGINYKEVDVMFMEKQNWFIKGGSFLMRKVKK